MSELTAFGYKCNSSLFRRAASRCDILCVLAILLFVQTHLRAQAFAIQAPVGTSCSDNIDLNDETQMSKLINKFGLRDFVNPPEVRPISQETRLDLVVAYAKVTVGGCIALLRTYNGSLVGPTIRASPGDTIFVRLINVLPPAEHKHPQVPPPPAHSKHFSFNITNLHTHGLHVAPQGDGPVNPSTGRRDIESDNVLLELPPGQTQDYQIKIPADHAAGTFWYHAHVHGGTAVQVGSGMAGALIIDRATASHGDLNSIPSVDAVKSTEKVMVIQQIWADKSGRIESLPSNTRPTLVNGQLVPTIRMRPGEFQRWRLVHAGVQENLALTMDQHPLNQVSADGISLGRLVPWPTRKKDELGKRREVLFLAPGYRSDVLLKINKDTKPGAYFLRTHKLPDDESIQVLNARITAALQPADSPTTAVAPTDLTAGQVLVQIVVAGDPVDMPLPPAKKLSEVVPEELKNITQEEIDRTLKGNPGAPRKVTFALGFAKCDVATGACTPGCSPGQDGCGFKFMVNNKQFTMDNGIRPISLKTNGEWTAAEWTVSSAAFPIPGTPPSAPGSHPFHIHVNPFQVKRLEPDGVERWTWKDTWLTYSDGSPGILRMRYRVFTGKFVLHCHILSHEDSGMMSVVEIVK